MNFLAHALLSFDEPEILTGNLMGDFVKGRKILETFPVGIKNGILLHREIDAYTDKHMAVQKAKNIFRPRYRLYSGSFVDIVFDHFLANDPRYFPDEQRLKVFTQKVYATVFKNEEYFPADFSRLYYFMSHEDWLFDYRTFRGLKQGLYGVTRRAKYLSEWKTAFDLTVRHYHELNQLYFELIDDVVSYVKNQLNGWRANSSS